MSMGWLRSKVVTELWSAADDQAISFTQVPSGSLFEQLASPVGGRALVQYFGNSVAAAGSVWLNLSDVEAVDEPAAHTEPEWPQPSNDSTWLQSQAPTELWSAEGSDAVAFTVVPSGSVFERLQPPQGTRVFAHYFGNSVSSAGDIWALRQIR